MELPTLEEIRKEKAKRSLEYFVPWATPNYLAPTHLRPLTSKLERFREEPFLFCASAPPRHTKTETAFIHFAPWVLWRWPETLITYVTYSASVAEEKNVKAREVAERIGLPIGSIDRQDMWLTREGGGVRAVGVGGSLMGRGSNIIIVDDPYASSMEAESPGQREKLRNWFQSTLFTRREPGASVVVFHQRWNEDDLIATLTASGWPYVNLPALSPAGEPLWQQRWPLVELDVVRKEVGEFYWAAQYMGQPRPRGLRVFNDVRTYRTLPAVYRKAGGVDLSYTAKTSSDYSVGVVLYEEKRPKPEPPLYYVVDVIRRQARAPQFRDDLRRFKADNKVRLHMYAAGTELGTTDLMGDGEAGVTIHTRTASADKFHRAQPFAAAWNDGRVLVPESAPWARDFIREIHAFTGVKDANDDQVDACAAAFDALQDDGDGIPKAKKPKEGGLYHSSV